MITVPDAGKIIFDHIQLAPTVDVSLQESYGAVLREKIYADRDQPAAHHVQMDGIAINFASHKSGRTKFPIEGIHKAGDPLTVLKNPDNCIEVMTGSLLPEGCDCVIPVEDLTDSTGEAILREGVTPEFMQFVRPQAQDYARGDLLIKEGCVLNPQQIAIAAAVGKTKIKVSAQPKIAVIGTGDELVEIDHDVKPHQSRRSNAYTLEAILKLNGFTQISCFHINDNEQAIRDSLKKIIEESDIIVLSGGVSMGKFDFIPSVLKNLGIQILFHKVKERPGKPLLFGLGPTNRPIFGLPGNPVSTQICAYRYVLPYLKRSQGTATPAPEHAILAEAFNPNIDLTFFLPVAVKSSREGHLIATPVPYTGSGHYATLANADGFVELPAEQQPFAAGYVARLFRW